MLRSVTFMTLLVFSAACTDDPLTMRPQFTTHPDSTYFWDDNDVLTITDSLGKIHQFVRIGPDTTPQYVDSYLDGEYMGTITLNYSGTINHSATWSTGAAYVTVDTLGVITEQWDGRCYEDDPEDEDNDGIIEDDGEVLPGCEIMTKPILRTPECLQELLGSDMVAFSRRTDCSNEERLFARSAFELTGIGTGYGVLSVTGWIKKLGKKFIPYANIITVLEVVKTFGYGVAWINCALIR